jgi:hypothetical protein
MANNTIDRSDDAHSEANDHKDYCICCDFDGNGQIYNPEKIVWRFQLRASKPRSPKPKFLDPVFIFCDSDGNELLTIHRLKLFLLARFKIVEKDLPIGTIRQRSILFTKYDFEINGGTKWNLYLPMFTVFGKGFSQDGKKVLIRIHSRKQWFVRFDSESNILPAMAALAFVTRKKIQGT